jgi:hypothetical protein
VDTHQIQTGMLQRQRLKFKGRRIKNKHDSFIGKLKGGSGKDPEANRASEKRMPFLNRNVEIPLKEGIEFLQIFSGPEGAFTPSQNHL